MAKRAHADLLQWSGPCLGLILLSLLAYTQRDWFLTGQNDFVQLYAGSKLSGTTKLYDPAASKQIHREVLGLELESVYYSRPPFYAFMLQPLGRLPYRIAYWTFEIFSMLALTGFLWIWARRCKELLIFASMFLPLLSTILVGQDLTFTLLAAGLALQAMRRGQNIIAGLLLSICAIKIHLFALVPIVLFVHRRWGVLTGGAIGGAVMLAVSFLSDGWDWPRRYWGLLSNPELHPGPEVMPTLRGLAFSLTGQENTSLQAILALAVVALVAFIARRNSFELGLGFALVGGLLIGYHAYLQDCALLLLTFVLTLEHSDWPLLRGAVALMLTPPLYLFLMAGRPWSAIVPLSLLGVLVIAVFHPAMRSVRTT